MRCSVSQKRRPSISGGHSANHPKQTGIPRVDNPRENTAQHRNQGILAFFQHHEFLGGGENALRLPGLETTRGNPARSRSGRTDLQRALPSCSAALSHRVDGSLHSPGTSLRGLLFRWQCASRSWSIAVARKHFSSRYARYNTSSYMLPYHVHGACWIVGLLTML